MADGNLERARSRLEGLKREDVVGAMRALMEEYAAASRPAETLRGLTTLAGELGVHTPAGLAYLHTPTAWALDFGPTPSLTRTPLADLRGRTSAAAPTPSPSRTPTPSSPVSFRVNQQEQICEPGQSPRIEVVMQDELGAGLAGLEVWLTWPGEADRAVTGLRPERGAGYVDFEVEPNATYALGIGALALPLVTDLRMKPCPPGREAATDEEPLLGSWRIVLQRQPSESE